MALDRASPTVRTNYGILREDSPHMRPLLVAIMVVVIAASADPYLDIDAFTLVESVTESSEPHRILLRPDGQPPSVRPTLRRLWACG